MFGQSINELAACKRKRSYYFVWLGKHNDKAKFFFFLKKYIIGLQLPTTRGCEKSFSF
jgi:hypothetical protein